VTIVLVDDQALSRIFRGDLVVSDRVYTTGLWYVRLCQAVVAANRPSTGQLSAPIAALPEPARAAAIAAVLALPDHIGLLSLRELGPTIATLRERHQLNLLSIEALAAAKRLSATVLLTTASPRLEAALEQEGLTATLV
jgi:hypothetical protein